MFSLAGYFAAFWLPERHRRLWLCVVSVLFYAWIDIATAGLLVALTLLVRAVCMRQGSVLWRRNTGLLLTAGILTIWRLLPETLGFFGTEVEHWWIPLASGFLALQSAIVIMDVYRKDVEVPSVTETMLLLGFFPKALAGPLVRTGTFLYNLRNKPTRVPLREVAVLLVSASFKKYVMSGPLETLAATVVPSSVGLSKIDFVVMFLIGPVRFVIDISAYTDLARAAGKMCGVELPENMRNPFGARTVGEFLRRWHVTVSGFFRDYVLAEVTSKRTSDLMLCLATMGTCVLIGVWHTPGLSTALWGALVGLPVGLEHVRSRRASRKREPRREARAYGVFTTVAYYGLLSPLYTNDTIAHNVRLVRNLFSLNGFSGPVTPWWGFVLLAAGMLWFSGAMGFIRERTDSLIERTPSWFLLSASCVAVAFFAGFSGTGIPNFVYQGL